MRHALEGECAPPQISAGGGSFGTEGLDGGSFVLEDLEHAEQPENLQSLGNQFGGIDQLKGAALRGDVETKETHRFDVEKKTVEVANRALGQR